VTTIATIKGPSSHACLCCSLTQLRRLYQTSSIPLQARFQRKHPTTMVHKILFWAGFGTLCSHEALCNPFTDKRLTGIATRFLQLGIEMRPFFQRGSLWVYTLFAGVGGSFGYWMKGVEDRQVKMLQQRKEILIEKRRRRAEREAVLGPEEALVGNVSS
jgi:hypothetical protein